MDFETAVQVSREIENKYPKDIVVAGFRRQRWDAPDSWAVDIVEPGTGKMITLDEKDDWATRLKELVPEERADQGREPMRRAG
jgi:hypothetical protein